LPVSKIAYTANLVLFLALPALSAADFKELPSTEQEIRIDGVLDEDAWQDAIQIDINVETKPGENIPARVKTTAYLVEDGLNLYVAFDAEDPDPSSIRAYLSDRDAAYNDDFVGIVLDTYGDERRAFEFFANPLGVQMDLTYDDINEREEDSWNAIWDSAGKITESGYVVEMKIPLSQLRFAKLDGKQSWGIDVLRMYPREHRYRMANNPQDRNINCYLCQFEKIEGLEDAKPSKDLEITPTLTASKVDTTDSPGVVPLQSGDAEVEAGISIAWGITPGLTANLTINPDFSQVEADLAQLDVNNQFALFFPETRPFFLEGADYFRTPIRAVFTRTVVDPSVGAKLTGKRGNNTFGVFVAQDEVTNLIFPGAFGSDSESFDEENNAFVGRYSRSFGESSSVGGLVTVRNGEGYHNYVGGLDMRWKISDQHDIRLQYLSSDTQYPTDVAIEFEQPLTAFDGTAAYASYDYSSRNWFAFLRHQDRSAGFRADSGFVPRVDISQQVVGLGHNWYGDEDDWYSQLQLSADWDIAHDDSGRMIEREAEFNFRIRGPMQSRINMGGLTRDILFDDVLFKENRISLFTEIQPTGGLRLGFRSHYGDKVDFANTQLGEEMRMAPFINWNVNRHLLLRLDSNFVKLDSKSGPNIFDAQVHDLRMTWQFNLRSFIRLTAQLQDVKRNQDEYIDPVDTRTRDVGRQLLYSYKLNPQTVFFLGYSDALIEDDDLSRLTTTDRTWFMKIGYAWLP
jgi:hypothetical protein